MAGLMKKVQLQKAGDAAHDPADLTSSPGEPVQQVEPTAKPGPVDVDQNRGDEDRVEPAPAPAAVIKPARPARPAKRRAKSTKPVKSAESAGGKQPIVVYLPLDLRLRFKRAAIGSTQLDVALDAVTAAEQAGILGDLVAADAAPVNDGLFERRQTRGGHDHVQVGIQPSVRNVELLDQLADRYGTNRSALIRVALAHHLAGRKSTHTAAGRSS